MVCEKETNEIKREILFIFFLSKLLDTVEETMPNASSPPISRDTPSPEPKRERKPGAKTVRWTDQASSLPLENVREFEVDPNERGETHSAGKNSSSLFPENKNLAETIFLKSVKFLTLVETFDIAI